MEFTHVFINKPFQPTTTAAPFSSSTDLAVLASYTPFPALDFPVDSLKQMGFIFIDVDSNCTAIAAVSTIFDRLVPCFIKISRSREDETETRKRKTAD
jgi:hypothetical protein